MSNFFEKEKIILATPERYLVFLDEVGDPYVHWNLDDYRDPSLFPVMTVTAVIVAKAVYESITMPSLDEIKEHFFKDKNMYFHSREIRRKDGIFKIFLDEKVYSEFKQRMNALLEKSSITIISSSINKIKFVEKAREFEKLSGDKYNIGDIYLRNVGYILERVGHFLKTDAGKIVFEIRGRKESRRIQAVLTDAKRNGTFYCPKERFANIANDIVFFTKEDNINGLQITDYCTYPFARHAKDNTDPDNKFFDVLRQYIYKGDYGQYGLKEWP